MGLTNAHSTGAKEDDTDLRISVLVHKYDFLMGKRNGLVGFEGALQAALPKNCCFTAFLTDFPISMHCIPSGKP